MPRYDYQCQKCGDIFEKIEPMKNYMKSQECKCGGKAERILTTGECKADALMMDNPRWSEAMGINPDQLPEFKKAFPDSTYDKRGRLLIKNRAHKLLEMKRRGYVEYE